jgi:L,D-transpeptidase YbiS
LAEKSLKFIKFAGLWRKPPKAAYGVPAVALLILFAIILFFTAGRSRPDGDIPAPMESARMDPAVLRQKVASLESKVSRLLRERERLFPAQPSILVDTSENRIYLVQGSKILWNARCSTGSGLQLTDESGNRSWTFETPRGHFSVLRKISDPVWLRPDWAFIEEGEPIPKKAGERAVPEVLGDYALAFGNGYFIHGTLYTRTLGNSVTHGCIRVDDDTLEKLYRSSHAGTPIWIY